MVPAETAARLACHARVQAILEDASGEALAVGRMLRDPPAWMARQLRYRDGGCVFPGCGTRWFTQGHHLVWWERGGVTELENLALVCAWHHRLVHEFGWDARREGTRVAWFRPDGSRFDPGPAPPEFPEQPQDWDPALPDAKFYDLWFWRAPKTEPPREAREPVGVGASGAATSR